MNAVLKTRRKKWRHPHCCSVFENGAWIGDLPDFVIQGVAYKARWESGLLRPSYVLEQDAVIVARTSRLSLFFRVIHVVSSENEFLLRAKFPLARTFVLCDGGRVIGFIGPETWLGLNIEADLPHDIPLPVRIFIVWLVLGEWKRSS